MKRWLVVTPEYGEVIPITDEGQGPTEYQSDVIEVEAETRRDAILIGVQLMRASPSDYHWFRDNCYGNPFVGVTAEEVQVPCRACEGTGDGDIHGVSGECSACGGTGVELPLAADAVDPVAGATTE